MTKVKAKANQQFKDLGKKVAQNTAQLLGRINYPKNKLVHIHDPV